MNGTRQAWWRWPLWSWGRLGATALVFAVLLFAVGRVQAWSSPSAEPKSSPAVSISAAISRVPSTNPTATSALGIASETPAAAALPRDARATAVAFVAVWARPYDAPKVWLAKLQPLSTQTFGEQLASADPSRVPATAFVDEGRVVSEGSTAAAIRVATDNGAVLVELARADDHWLVQSIKPAE